MPATDQPDNPNTGSGDCKALPETTEAAPLPKAAAFWAWTFDVYPAVKTPLLTAQDEYGADINLCLLYAWLDQAGWTLTVLDQARLLRLSAHWQAVHLAPLRRRRSAARGTWGYSAAKAAELDAERAAQAALLAALYVPQRRTATGAALLPAYLAERGAPAALAGTIAGKISAHSRSSG